MYVHPANTNIQHLCSVYVWPYLLLHTFFMYYIFSRINVTQYIVVFHTTEVQVSGFLYQSYVIQCVVYHLFKIM